MTSSCLQQGRYPDCERRRIDLLNSVCKPPLEEKDIGDAFVPGARIRGQTTETAMSSVGNEHHHLVENHTDFRSRPAGKPGRGDRAKHTQHVAVHYAKDGGMDEFDSERLSSPAGIALCIARGPG